MGLLSLTACTRKETGPSIDEVVGEYDAQGTWTGDFNFSLNPRMFTVTKSGKGDNLLTIRIEINNSRTEIWEVKYFAGGSLVMDNQVVIGMPNNPNTYKEYQESLGKATGDSLIIEGLRSFSNVFVDKPTYCKYRAKKKR